MLRKSFEVERHMIRAWAARLRRFTSLPIVVMHAFPTAEAEALLDASRLRLQLQRIDLVVVDPPGTPPWCKPHASLPSPPVQRSQIS